MGWALLIAFSILWVALGVFWGRKAKNLDGYMLAGRNVGMALGTATAMATWVTSNTTMLAPQFALQLGIWGMVAYSTASFGLMLFAPLAKRIRLLMPSGFTSGDFIRIRYGNLAWYIFLAISIFYSITWLISMSMAGGIVLNAVSGIDYKFGMSVILWICVIYTLFGGLYAVVGTDYIQSLIILVGVVIVGVGVLIELPLGTVYRDLEVDNPGLLNLLLPASIMALFNNLLFGLGEIFHSNVWWTRAFAMRQRVARNAYLLAGFCWLPIPIAAGFIALASGSLGINVTSPDMVGPLVAAELLGYVGAIGVFIVIFCSLASSIDSLLAATSALITEDIYRKMIHPRATDSELKRMAAYIILGLGLVAWLVSLPRINDLASVLFYAGPMVGSTIWPIVTGLYWRRANPTAAVLGMFLGSVAGLIAYYKIGFYAGALVGAATSMVFVLVINTLAPRDFQWDRLNEAHPSDPVKPEVS